MKKELFLLATAATLFAACTNTEDFRDVSYLQNAENDGSIDFTSFAEKATKGVAENSNALYTWTFFEHQESFQVWGHKSNLPSNEIFNGTTVNVSRTGSAGSYTYNYSYAPKRFWDKGASKYYFYAAAPAFGADDAEKFVFNIKNTFNQNDENTFDYGYFTTSATLYGVNLQSVENGGASDDLKNVFKGAKVTISAVEKNDIDKLIAAPCVVPNTYYNIATPQAVNLNFIHILSKLNITISTKLYDASDDYYKVELLGFEVHNIPNSGTFNESAAIPDGKKAIRWTPASTPSTTNILTGIDDNEHKLLVEEPTAAGNTGAKKYIVESLIIPQEIDYERVALDGGIHPAINQNAVPFADYEEYTQARHDDVTRLTREQFNALFTGGTTFKEWSAYTDIEGEHLKNDADGEDTFNDRVLEATKTPAINIEKYEAPTKPYFTITYSIDGDIFTQTFNLAAAFLGYNNNNQKTVNNVLTNLNNDDPKKFGFYEGWQNTLNIIINPTAIEFTADVAEWSTNANVDYEIEQGNE